MMNSQRKRAVIYARYSGERQREASIDDQVRNCRRWAEREHVDVRQIYSDKAITGAVRVRAGYLEMLAAAMAGEFDVLLVDDLSRFSRDDVEMKTALRKLEWQKVRVVGVTEGYDSVRTGHKIHAGVKGLMNELYLDDVRAWTRRGMTGKAEDGYSCGGRIFGYRNVPIEHPERLDPYGRPSVVAVKHEVNEQQAEIVRRIYDAYADGYSYAAIADQLNREKTPASRGGSWAMSAIKVILENELYQGTLIWNRRAWMRHPDTGKRTYSARPREEWIVVDKPELRLVSDDVVRRVRERQRSKRHMTSEEAAGSKAAKYLFSGLLQCGECRASFVLVANGRYGCAAHRTRGKHVCSNAKTVSRLIVEDRLLRQIKSQLLSGESIQQFKAKAAALLEQHISEDHVAGLRRERQNAERRRINVLKAIQEGVITASTKSALEEEERLVESLDRQLDTAERSKVGGVLPRAVERYQGTVCRLEAALGEHVEPAREILRSLLGDRIVLHRCGSHLEAEIPNGSSAFLRASLEAMSNSRGCGGPQRHEFNFEKAPPTWISLAPISKDCTPRKHRKLRS